MEMSGRERLLTAISNKKPDRLPCQVHNWMPYYLKTYLNDMTSLEAYKYFGMDPVLYLPTDFKYDFKVIENCVYKRTFTENTPEGYPTWVDSYTTPKGVLTEKSASNQYTSWVYKHLIETDEEFEIWREYYPAPSSVDWSNIRAAKKELGETGIIRTWGFGYGQPGTWSSLCYLIGTEKAIFKAIDEPEWTAYALSAIADKAVQAVNAMGEIEVDLIETGGGSASNTVISPSMHEEFALPYDKRIHDAIHNRGGKLVYHLCGGVMKLLDIVVQNGADALETLTPPGMGADVDMAKANEAIGDKVCFIGGLDQNYCFEKGGIETVEDYVEKLFYAKNKGGYICSPSDHFFDGKIENIKAFVDKCKSLKY